MKSFLTSTALTLFASLAFAGHGDVQINWPAVNGLAINNACATDDTFVSLNGVSTCTATKTVRYAVSNQGEVGYMKRQLAAGEQPNSGEWLETEEVCSAYGTVGLTVSRYVTTSECAYYPRGGEAYEPACTQYVTKTSKVGRTFSVEQITSYGEADQQTFFNFTVPLCE